MNNWVRIVGFSAIAFIGVGLSTGARAEVKIAVVDLQRAINETQDGKQAKARLKKVFDQRQKSLDDAQNKLKAMKDELEKKKDVLARDVLQKKLEEYQKNFVELQSKYVDYQKELASKEGELTKTIVARMERILRVIGQQRAYSLILERSEGGVVWTPTQLDLTGEVIQRYNKGEGREGEKKAPASKSTKTKSKK
ncbi:MAG: OmpH family outer membrane protein [Myxococcales bacterium]|nr:OmpH family outer membrane protein [Myxococcales bacterium]MCB9708343.1 OmpH family outer membrane protein [Myxococcales bacterium]